MALKPRPSSLAGGSRVEFELENFIAAIENHGYEVRWSKATFCPNRDPEQEDHHRLSCPLCDENGFVYYDPQNIRVHATSFGLRQLFMPESRYEPGTVYFTAKPEHKLSFWDKLELLASKARHSQVVRVDGTTYKLRYKALELVHVLGSDGTVVDPDSITINPDGSISLPTTPGGDFLSVSYEHRPVFVVIDVLHYVRDRRQTEQGQDLLVEFPNQVMARLDFLVRDESED